MSTEEIIEGPNILVEAISKRLVSLILVLWFTTLFALLLFYDKITADQFISLVALEGTIGALIEILKRD